MNKLQFQVQITCTKCNSRISFWTKTAGDFSTVDDEDLWKAWNKRHESCFWNSDEHHNDPD